MNKNKIIVVFGWMLIAMLCGCSDLDARAYLLTQDDKPQIIRRRLQ